MSDRDIFGKEHKHLITSDDILGKDVIDSEGNILGVVEKVYIDRREFDFAGIAVDKGFFKKGFNIGKGYIERITKHSVILKISVMYELKGKRVFDSDGSPIGKVKSIHLQGMRNSLKSIEVRKGLFDTVDIPASRISTMGDNIILNVLKKDILAHANRP